MGVRSVDGHGVSAHSLSNQVERRGLEALQDRIQLGRLDIPQAPTDRVQELRNDPRHNADNHDVREEGRDPLRPARTKIPEAPRTRDRDGRDPDARPMSGSVVIDQNQRVDPDARRRTQDGLRNHHNPPGPLVISPSSRASTRWDAINRVYEAATQFSEYAQESCWPLVRPPPPGTGRRGAPVRYVR